MISVVLADDAADLRALMAMVLRRDGRFDVVGEAANGRQAIALADAHQPAVLLLDLAMPVMDGLEALPEILRVSPHTRVIVVSGFDRDDVGEQALAAGAVRFVQKGRELRTLPDTIADVVARAAPPPAVP